MARTTTSATFGTAVFMACILLLAGTALAGGPTAVVNRYTFYNNSFHDGYNPAIDPAPIAGDNNDDTDAIDPTKAPLLQGRGPATFANWTGCTHGITGLMYDYANTALMPDPSAFSFLLIGKDGSDTPVPVVPGEFAVLPGGGPAGATRVVVTFPGGMVKNTWLRVYVDTSFGLPAADVHYWANAAGDTGSTVGNAIMVDQIDEQAILDHPWPNPLHPLPGPIPVSWHWNLNKDAWMNAMDVALCRSHFNTALLAVKIVDARSPASVAGRHVFYNQSYFDGNKLGIDPLPIPTTADPLYIPHEDDGDAIDPSKWPLRPGDGAATFANWTGYYKGINGLVYDFTSCNRNPVPDDFAFHNIGKFGTNLPGSAVEPDGFQLQDLGGITRLFLTFPNNAIANTWLQVEIGTGFGLPAPDVHWWANVIGEGGSTQGSYAIVDATDEIQARMYPRTAFNRAPVDWAWDYNKNSLCDATDQVIARNARAPILDWVKIIVR